MIVLWVYLATFWVVFLLFDFLPGSKPLEGIDWRIIQFNAANPSGGTRGFPSSGPI